MIHLKKLILEQQERKFLLPPSGDIFQVRDHISWAVHGILSHKYKNYSRENIADIIEDIYDELESMGYKILIFAPDDTLYIRGENGIKSLTSEQRRKIENLILKLGNEGTHSQIQLEDDGGNYELAWVHPVYQNKNL
jgi:hypothetical protein